MTIIDEPTGCCNQRNATPDGATVPRGGPSGGRATGGPLGIVTKRCSPEDLQGSQPDGFDPDTGEFIPSTKRTPQEARADRWALKSIVNRLLPGSRTSKCMVLRAPVQGHGLADIDVCMGQTHKRAFYQGLMACGGVWTCTVCASKISERRRQELRQAIDAATSLGMNVHFVTLTIPHGIGDDIKVLNGLLSKALRELTRGKASLKNKIRAHDPGIEIHGFIRAFEVTHTVNGFHPHYHILVFTNDQITSDGLHPFYRDAWKRACRLVGLPEPHHVHGCEVKDGSFASEYVTKWGLEDEMTKAHTKTTKRKGLTPWGLLRAVLDGDDPDYPPERAGKLFLVYADAFKGRHQLYWSTGLRKLLTLPEKELTDEELVATPEDERALVLATLSDDQWRGIRRRRHEATILSVAESSPEALPALLAQLAMPPDATSAREDSELSRKPDPVSFSIPKGPLLSDPLPDLVKWAKGNLHMRRIRIDKHSSD